MNLISSKIGFTVSNSEVADELLNKYPESEIKTLKSLIYDEQLGMINAKLIFNK